MFKLKFFLILFFLIFNEKISYANNTIGINELCQGSNEEINFNNLKFIDIEISKSSKWYQNIIKAALSEKDHITEKFKKKFKANITFVLTNNIKCKSKGLVRINGDFKDHLNVRDPNNISASLDIKLIDGNFNNVVKFKLFLPETKKSKNSIIFSVILEEMGFLKRREKLLNVSVNGISNKYLFLEKVSKEFLEYNSLKEGPIITINENLIWQNQKNYNFFLAKIYNSNWTARNINNLMISKEALDMMNIVYMDYHIRHSYFKKNDRLDLNFEILENYGYDIFQLRNLEMLLLAFNGHHGLFVNNRKYYYDPLYKKFYPISYDETPHFGITDEKEIIKQQIFFQKKNVDFVLNKLNLLDNDKILKKINHLDISINKDELKKIINNSIVNLKKITDYNLNNKKNTKIDKVFISDYFSKIKNYKYEKIFSDNNLNFFKCNTSQKCTEMFINIKEKSRILGNKEFYKKNNKNFHHYIGLKDFYYNGNIKKNDNHLKKFTKNNINILYEDGLRFDFNEKKKTINIFQTNDSKKIIFYKSKIEDYKIFYYGKKIKVENNSKDVIRNDKNNLTGCMNFYDVNFSNTSILLDNASCEDGVNFVRTSGFINFINIKNTKSDAIDFDFSNIKIKKIDVFNAGNDCTDFSYGTYIVEKINTSNCSDKAVSVGEKSIVTINNLYDYKSKIPLAVKDSSEVKMLDLKSDNKYFCALSYRKKQEFSGGKITLNKFTCDGKFINDKGSVIKIL